jgi:hypothetical protein
LVIKKLYLDSNPKQWLDVQEVQTSLYRGTELGDKKKSGYLNHTVLLAYGNKKLEQDSLSPSRFTLPIEEFLQEIENIKKERWGGGDDDLSYCRNSYTSCVTCPSEIFISKSLR